MMNSCAEDEDDDDIAMRMEIKEIYEKISREAEKCTFNAIGLS